jgi:hypothetical protein
MFARCGSRSPSRRSLGMPLVDTPKRSARTTSRARGHLGPSNVEREEAKLYHDACVNTGRTATLSTRFRATFHTRTALADKLLEAKSARR